MLIDLNYIIVWTWELLLENLFLLVAMDQKIIFNVILIVKK